MNGRILLLALLLYPLALSGAATATESSPRVTSIVITGNRVREAVIRRALTFTEGDRIDEGQIARSRKNLYALRLFKTVDITVDPSPAGEVTVRVTARDGWFVLPWPMFGSRGGERYASGLLFEQNVFRNAERVIVFGSVQENASFMMGSVILPGCSFALFFDRRAYTEYRYADGAYNTTILSEKDLARVQSYGTVSDAYRPETSAVKALLTVPLGHALKGTLGGGVSDTQYDASSPHPSSDEGRIVTVVGGLQFGTMENSREAFFQFGRIAGLGLAGLKDGEGVRPAAATTYGFAPAIETALAVSGSEHEYTKITLSGTRTTVFSNRSRLAFVLKAGGGVKVPERQLFAANRREGLIGVYAREFRGDRIALATASYQHPFLRSDTGFFTGELFADCAGCGVDGAFRQKQGAGANLAYCFWRFPLPVGIGYTFSADDNEWQASFGIGGMF